MKKTKWKKFFGKKWTFPALYMVAAALILTLMWTYQDPNDYPVTPEELGLEEVNPEAVGSAQDDLMVDDFGEAVAVTQNVEKMAWPVESTTDVQIRMEYFDDNATEEEMAGALVNFENELWPHAGIDIVASNGKTFNVVAALSGEVTRAEKDPVVGYVVEVQHENGVITHYSSLQDLKVEKGDEVKQGSILGLASRNTFEKDHGIHVHFEVRKDGLALRPDTFFDQDVAKVLDQLANEDTEEKATEENQQEEADQESTVEEDDAEAEQTADDEEQDETDNTEETNEQQQETEEEQDAQ